MRTAWAPSCRRGVTAAGAPPWRNLDARPPLGPVARWHSARLSRKQKIAVERISDDKLMTCTPAGT